jgi:hypothetical protein
VTADHSVRPIIVPRDVNALPWNSGYAETINAGKSRQNEDQACVREGRVNVMQVRSSSCLNFTRHICLGYRSAGLGYCSAYQCQSLAGQGQRYIVNLLREGSVKGNIPDPADQ